MSIVIVLTLGKITQILENHGSRPVATKENTTHQEKKNRPLHISWKNQKLFMNHENNLYQALIIPQIIT